MDVALELAHYDSHTSTAELWLELINDFKTCQEALRDKIQNNLESIYRTYNKNATDENVGRLFDDNHFRAEAIKAMRRESLARLKSLDPDMWPRYDMRFRDLKRLMKDLKIVEDLIEESEVGTTTTHKRDYEISQKGDTILDFPNTGAKDIPPLRFRVLSHVLAEFSPLFAQMFATDASEVAIDPEMINDLPKASYRQMLKDGSEVTVHRMPQVEANVHEALTTLLHAAHLHTDKVPQNLEFDAFVSIAEVCLRYRCTSPVEWAVESRWLSQMQDAIGDQMREDHLLFISYVFNLEEVFTQTSKEVILHLTDEDELQEKTLWPKDIRDKILAMRTAKLSQIQQCCNSVVQGYLRPGRTDTSHGAGAGSLQLSSVPKCPKHFHTCDAKNLGWTMLQFNELSVLPNVVGYPIYTPLASQPNRSLQSVVQDLQKIASTPDLHSDVCDFAPSFRGAIGDLYDSIQGLTLSDVKGQSKGRHELAKTTSPQIHELPALVRPPMNHSLSASSIIDGGRSSPFSMVSGQGQSTDDADSAHSHPQQYNISAHNAYDRPSSTATDQSNSSATSSTYRIGSPVSPLTRISDEATSSPLSKEELDHILYSKPSNSSDGKIRGSTGVLWYPRSTNEKFFPEAKKGVKEKLPGGQEKYLREEQDKDFMTRPARV